MKTVLIVDCNNMIYRAHYAHGLGGLGAVSMIKGAIARLNNTNDLKSQVICVFDGDNSELFRKQLIGDYKAGRTKIEDIGILIEAVKEELRKTMNVKIVESPERYEADDVIGTFARKLTKKYKVIILTGDKDFLQLITEDINVMFLQRGGIKNALIYTPNIFKQEFKIPVSKYLDYKVLLGDKSDNVKKVSGIGEKTALKLLKDYGSLPEIVNAKEFQVFIKGENKDEVFKQLIINRYVLQIHTDIAYKK